MNLVSSGTLITIHSINCYTISYNIPTLHCYDIALYYYQAIFVYVDYYLELKLKWNSLTRIITHTYLLVFYNCSYPHQMYKAFKSPNLNDRLSIIPKFIINFINQPIEQYVSNLHTNYNKTSLIWTLFLAI